MKKIYVYALLVFLIAVFALVSLLGIPPDPYSVQVEGVVLKGNNASPLEIIPGLAAGEEFVVSAEVHDPMQQSDSLMFNGSALFLVVLTGNGKGTTQVLRVVDGGGNLSRCLTNYGDLRTEEGITAEQCNEMLNDPDKVVILINFPNPALSKPMVSLSEKRIVVESNSIDAVNNTSFTVLKAMFGNAEEVLARSNTIAGMLG